MSRSIIREARRSLRRHGCNCHPVVHEFGPEVPRPEGTTAGMFVRHQTGCYLGDAVAGLNLVGIVPAIFDTSPERCDR